ncbi:MAG TPA: GvpL/GvpF family gas vesicle protein [Vulgatibacter sp.]
MTTGGKVALYVYGFVPAGHEAEISSPGIDGSADVTALPLGEIAALVSPLAVEDLVDAEGNDRALDMDWVAPRALRHEQVVEEVMRRSPVLPLTFGVVFSSEQALSEAVGPHQRRISEFLDFIADKQEWAVKVYADAGKVREYLEHSQGMRERLERPPESPGARYFHQKRLVRDLDRLAVDERRDAADRIRQELAPDAIEVKSLRLSPRELTGRQDDMVMNSAFLEQADDVESFTERVRRLADEYEPRGFTIEATGPWPPYSFSPRLQVET